MTNRLAGQVALLTGAGSGIGWAVLEAFRAEGARICVLESDEAKVANLAGLGDDVLAVKGDATSANDCNRSVVSSIERFGRLDALATFVGVFDHYLHATAIPDGQMDAAFTEMFEVNVKSVLLAVRASAAELAASRGSVTITCSSSSFFPGRGGSLYVSSKFALRGLVTQLAHELAPAVRVNGVAPGGTVSTDLRGLRALEQHDNRLDDRPGRVESLRERTPLGVALSPGDHAGAYVYLASREAPGVSGEIVRSDGGLSIR
jgi:NAD(P)-dependent dehydrogenase (short-subunit alcohol dehydrogenase family)